MSANADIIRQLYAAIVDDDISPLLTALDANVVSTNEQGFPYRGTFTGIDAVLTGVLARLGGAWERFRVATLAFIECGDNIVVLGRYTGTKIATCEAFEADFAHVWSLRDDVVVHFRQYVDLALVQNALQL